MSEDANQIGYRYGKAIERAINSNLHQCGSYERMLNAIIDELVKETTFTAESQPVMTQLISSFSLALSNIAPWLIFSVRSVSHVQVEPESIALDFKVDGEMVVGLGVIGSTANAKRVKDFALTTETELPTITVTPTANAAGINFPIYSLKQIVNEFQRTMAMGGSKVELRELNDNQNNLQWVIVGANRVKDVSASASLWINKTLVDISMA